MTDGFSDNLHVSPFSYSSKIFVATTAATASLSMKSVFSTIAGGMGFLFIGLLLEFLALPGMCSRTGYWHLKKLDSFFYALHSETNVILIASACNFIIGSVLGFIAGLISTSSKN